MCHDVRVESELQPLTGESLPYATANIQDGGGLDISVIGVWGGHFKKTYFDVRVFNPLAPSNRCVFVILLLIVRGTKRCF